MKKEVKKRSNDTLIVKDQESRSIHVICNLSEGTVYGKVWKILRPEQGQQYAERIAYVKGMPVFAQVPGYYVYISIDNYTGMDSLPELYSFEQIADKMARYLYENDVSISPQKYKDSKIL